MQVHVKSHYTICGKILVEGECTFSFNVNQDRKLQKVVLFPNENKIEVYYQFEMTEEDEGGKMRNKLIHRPSLDLEVSYQKAIKYVWLLFS